MCRKARKRRLRDMRNKYARLFANLATDVRDQIEFEQTLRQVIRERGEAERKTMLPNPASTAEQQRSELQARRAGQQALKKVLVG